ncbi:transporter substrate-binding domain-containing protein [Vibrio sp. SCSIO 43136]|uniref:diguanylate cyclase n=1 Tax=Vibrio sp. SCSIO 43136 TaxID=2819101 RepID=UPI0020762BCF|nr:transporter substrate-binding domain-containing protein [Vibrio sp. SCSIO 43136]USD67664.1 diguanylate cyclase [Vibrio sp. SCSIO 43136]
MRVFLSCLFAVLLLASETVRAQIELSEQEQDFIRANPIWRVHSDSIWPPYNYHEFGEPKGYVVELLTIASQKVGVQLEWVNNDAWATSDRAINNGSVDINIHLSGFPQIADELVVSKVGLFSTWSSLVFGSHHPSVDTLDELTHHTVAVVKGSMEETILKKDYPEIQRVVTDDSIHLLEMVKSGDADAAIGDERVLKYHLKHYLVSNLKTRSLKSHPRLGERQHKYIVHSSKSMIVPILDSAIADISESEINALRDKWWRAEESTRVQALNLTQDERDYLFDKHTIRYCSHPDLMPISSTEGGKLQGMAQDYMAYVEQSLGVQTRLVEAKSWPQAQFLLKMRECDLLTMSNRVKQRLSYSNYTEPYLSLTLGVVIHQQNPYAADLETLNGRSIGLAKNGLDKELLEEAYPNIEFVEVDSARDGFAMIEDKALFGYVGLLPRMTYLLQKEYPSLMVASQLGEPLQVSFAVRSDEPELARILNKAIKNMGVKLHTSVANSWTSVEYRPQSDLRLVWAVLVIALVVLSAVGYSYYILRRQYNKLRKLSTQDRLTGLYNRYTIDTVMAEQFAEYRFSKKSFSVILADIDHFKILNDHHGHLVGDEVLINTSQILSSNVANTDLVGRWGGEEFIIICPNRTEEQAVRLAETLREQIVANQHPKVGNVTCSFGVAEFEVGINVIDLMQRADRALYQSKRVGRNAVTSHGDHQPSEEAHSYDI